MHTTDDRRSTLDKNSSAVVISSKNAVHITACLISEPTCWLGGTARDLQLDDQTMGTPKSLTPKTQTLVRAHFAQR
eukprot:14736-Heterococcus_DN1.PRE.3